ncbi:hypothetical protein L873DRAFT_1802277 [Choiromyces venosus 120613-1]|uniref:Secreted protein n=1 Tax=Choiromyces venosus 120613-1 TaxID=1336337 RepID=A0A3N4K8R9_9PEZI|nr:hypothetical protein L873DRAFT_1802277 [Choiromyces venosus 120613-1]
MVGRHAVRSAKSFFFLFLFFLPYSFGSGSTTLSKRYLTVLYGNVGLNSDKLKSRRMRPRWWGLKFKKSKAKRREEEKKR